MTNVLHHIGWTVPNLSEATAFLRDVLGCEHLFTTQAGEPMDETAAAALNLRAGARCKGISMLKAGGALIELFQYEAEGQQTEPPANSDIGGAHLAFAVDDLEAATRRVEAAGGQVCSPVNAAKSQGFEGLLWVYFVAPWGQTFELVDVSRAPLLSLGTHRQSGGNSEYLNV